jgi:hypothetical protein
MARKLCRLPSLVYNDAKTVYYIPCRQQALTCDSRAKDLREKHCERVVLEAEPHRAIDRDREEVVLVVILGTVNIVVWYRNQDAG